MVACFLWSLGICASIGFTHGFSLLRALSSWLIASDCSLLLVARIFFTKEEYILLFNNEVFAIDYLGGVLI